MEQTLPCTMKLNKLQFEFTHVCWINHRVFGESFLCKQQPTRFPFSARFPFKQQLVVWFSTSSSSSVAKYILTLCNSGSSKHKIVGNIASWNFITRAAHFWHTLKPSFKNRHIFTKHPKLNPYFLEASFLRN